MIRAILLLALLAPGAWANAPDFPRPAALQPAVDFWVKVYTGVSTSQGYIHDDERLSVIYRTLDLPPHESRSDRDRRIRTAVREVADALHSLGRGRRSGLTATEAQVLAAWPEGTDSRTFARAAERVRFQLGQSDRFLAGLIRSGQWKPHIREVLAEYGLPRELEVLPHVESSFNPGAFSKAAAAGMWQFMPATARQYMRVDHVADERMDPFIATEGAARLLKTNYRITGTWPLALTGYNHGAGGMVRASKAVGTTDIDVIVERYKGRAFGFASRNFYASFLAALEVDRNPGRYFGDVRLDSPVPYDVVVVREYIAASVLAREAGIALEQLRLHNPALLEPVWSGEKLIPRGYPVRVPREQLARPLETVLASLPADARLPEQKPDLIHRIASGDSLSTIARRYGTSVSKLMALNGLRNHHIRAGKTLILPGSARADQLAAAPSQAAAGLQEYVIRRGDSLWKIAQRFNVSPQQLQAWNDIQANQILRPGQKLRIASAG